MNVILDFEDRRRKKQWNFERKVLRKLSLSKIRGFTHSHFPGAFDKQIGKSFIEDCCVDLAIDAYLLGAEFSRFGYYGESTYSVKLRCSEEYKDLIDHLYNQLSGWIAQFDNVNEQFYSQCERYINYWWDCGFKEGEKRYRLRLH